MPDGRWVLCCKSNCLGQSNHGGGKSHSFSTFIESCMLFILMIIGEFVSESWTCTHCQCRQLSSQSLYFVSRAAPHDKIEATSSHEKNNVGSATKVSSFIVSMDACISFNILLCSTYINKLHRRATVAARHPVLLIPLRQRLRSWRLRLDQLHEIYNIYAYSHYMLAVPHANRKTQSQKNHTPSSAV